MEAAHIRCGWSALGAGEEPPAAGATGPSRDPLSRSLFAAADVPRVCSRSQQIAAAYRALVLFPRANILGFINVIWSICEVSEVRACVGVRVLHAGRLCCVPGSQKLRV